MKLVTFQSMESLKSLIANGYLETNPKFINFDKVGYAYSWIVDKMNRKVLNKYNTKYPLWCWVKCYNNICPPRKKGTPVSGFDVKITFNKKDEDVFVTDFRKYSFLLNNVFIPSDLKEKEKFDKLLDKYKITLKDLEAYVRRDKYDIYRKDKQFLNVCKKIYDSFDKCMITDGDILQGCVWRINIDEVEKIEILNDDGYMYGSLNYIRSNGQRFNWIDDYYNSLK